MEALRIALLSPRHPSDSSIGIANVVSPLSSLLAELGHEVTVYYFSTTGTETRAEEVWKGVRAIQLPLRAPHQIPKSVEMEVSYRLSRALPPDLDALFVNNEFGALVSRAVSDRGTLVVVTLHGLAVKVFEFDRWNRPPGVRPRLGHEVDMLALRWLERLALRRADVWAPVSHRVQEEATALYGGPRRASAPIYNGVDPQAERTETDRTEARKRLGIPDGAPCLAFVGREPFRKGLDIAIGSVQRLREAGEEVTLLNVGNAHPSSRGVRSFGTVPASTKQDVLLASDVFLFPSRYEGFPAAIQEAAASGLPVLTSPDSRLDIGRPGSDYFLAAHNSPPEYARVLHEVLQDPRRLSAVGRSGRSALAGRTYLDQARDYVSLVRTAKLS